MINLFPIHHVIKFSILKEMGITYNAPTFEFHLLYKFASKYQGDQDVRGISIKCREFCMSQYIYIYIYIYHCIILMDAPKTTNVLVVRFGIFFFLMLDLYSLIVVDKLNKEFFFLATGLIKIIVYLEGLQRRSTKTNHILHGAWRMVLPGKQLKNNA